MPDTVTAVLPYRTTYFPDRDLVITFQASGNASGMISTLFIPAGATKFPATLDLSSAISGAGVGEAMLDVEVRLRDLINGQEISTLLKPLELRAWGNVGTPLVFESGKCPQTVPSLQGVTLRGSAKFGFTRYSDGSLTIIAKQLSRFTTSPEVVAQPSCPFARTAVNSALREQNRVLFMFQEKMQYLLLDFKSSLAGKKIEVQLRRKTEGVVSLTTIGLVTLDESGDGVIIPDSSLKLGDSFRVTSSNRLIPFRTLNIK